MTGNNLVLDKALPLGGTDRSDDGLGAFNLHLTGPERHESVLTAGEERPVRGVHDLEHGLAVRHVASACGQVEGDLAGTHVRVFLLRVLQLHVGAELVPRDGAIRRPVDLVEQRVDLLHLRHTCKSKVKSSSYIAQYPVLRTVQSALHFTSLTCLLRHHLGFSGKHPAICSN